MRALVAPVGTYPAFRLRVPVRILSSHAPQCGCRRAKRSGAAAVQRLQSVEIALAVVRWELFQKRGKPVTGRQLEKLLGKEGGTVRVHKQMASLPRSGRIAACVIHSRRRANSDHQAAAEGVVGHRGREPTHWWGRPVGSGDRRPPLRVDGICACSSASKSAGSLGVCRPRIES